jgi:hypothetical protein
MQAYLITMTHSLFGQLEWVVRASSEQSARERAEGGRYAGWTIAVRAVT